jgi:hypothetical protein
VLYFGSAVFKIARLLFIAMLCVHFFACIYYRVKRDTTPNPDDVEAFYASKYVSQDVSRGARSSFRARCDGALIVACFPFRRNSPAPMSVSPPVLLCTQSPAPRASLTAKRCAVAAGLLLLRAHHVHDRRIR